MPPKGARRHPANQHNSRHESGLAQPGKRVDKLSRQKIQNGSASVQPHPADGQRTLLRHRSSTASEESLTDAGQRPDGMDDAVPGAGAGQTLARDTPADGLLRAADVERGRPPRRIDVNAPGNPAVHVDANGPLQIAYRIIKSYPLIDTLAILIFLLQLPPTLLTVIHFLYATLTVVPPPSPTSVASVATLSEMLDFSAGAPSLATMLLADVIALAGWLFLWTPAQNLAVDLAQAVIAASFGGGTEDKDGSISNTIICITVIAVTRLCPSEAVRLPARPLSPKARLRSARPPAYRPLSSMPSAGRAPASNDRSWIRAILGIHILTQALFRIVRRRLSGQERGSAGHSTRKSDLDASSSSPSAAAEDGGGAQINVALEAGTSGDSAADGASSAPGSSPSAKDGKESGSSKAKRRKRQGVHARNSQPFWAALASTKTVVLKGYEHSQAAADAARARAWDISNLGNAPFPSEEGLIWVARVDTTEIIFQCSSFDWADDAPNGQDSADGSGRDDEHTLDYSKLRPFYVRINQADWPSTRVRCLADKGSAHDRHTRSCLWAVEVYGLAPGTNYTCEFVRSTDCEVLYSLELTTQPLPTAETATPNLTNSSVSQPLRPSSPTTTLKMSFAAAEVKLEEERASLRKLRKEHKGQLASLKKEVDALSARLAMSGSGDERQRHRLQQIGQHIRQAEDAVAALAAQAAALDAVPEEELLGWRMSKERWKADKEQHSHIYAELTEQATTVDRQKSSLQAEALLVQQKRERVQARQSKVTDQHDRLESVELLHAKDEKEQQQPQQPPGQQQQHSPPPPPPKTSPAAVSSGGYASPLKGVEDKPSIIDHYTGQVEKLRQALQEAQLGSQQLWQQVHAIEAAFPDPHRSSPTPGPLPTPLSTPLSKSQSHPQHQPQKPSGGGNFSPNASVSASGPSPHSLQQQQQHHHHHHHYHQPQHQQSQSPVAAARLGSNSSNNNNNNSSNTAMQQQHQQHQQQPTTSAIPLVSSPPSHVHFPAARSANLFGDGRARSSSVRSNFSGFAENYAAVAAAAAAAPPTSSATAATSTPIMSMSTPTSMSNMGAVDRLTSPAAAMTAIAAVNGTDFGGSRGDETGSTGVGVGFSGSGGRSRSSSYRAAAAAGVIGSPSPLAQRAPASLSPPASLNPAAAAAASSSSSSSSTTTTIPFPPLSTGTARKAAGESLIWPVERNL